ncbi:Importin subunit beta-2 [Cyberlindnera fabianii]|uniref:Importin subunit beta-2 n=1 Tax=Cyberlindnera fabianii TaxID=36022 RepID=A0A1V2LAQ1_CYBFA|nr:Importin subunit beta-2 [Cyberlindnera fabianii]
MSWSPDSTALGQLHHILGGTLSPHSEERRQATDALSHAKSQADFNNYLVYILVTEDPNTPSQIRAAAGLSLKNSVQKDFHIGTNAYLLSTILRGLLSSDTLVRNITGTVITTLFAQLGVKGWPAVIPELVTLAETGSTPSREGATGALSKICEDSGHILNAEYDGTRPLDVMVPKFLELLGNLESAKVRANSLASLNHIAELKTQSFYVHLETFLQRLFILASDQDKSVHRNVCAAFIVILENRPDQLIPHLEGVIQYVIHSITSDADDEVKLEACEFLFTLAGCMDIPTYIIEPHLKLIIPERITSEQWPVREAAILGFGAIAEGCAEFSQLQIGELIPFLVDRLRDQEAPVRQITCWTLSRYSQQICSTSHVGGACAGYFNPTFAAILQCCVDKKKTVQESACSAIAQFIDNADPELIKPLATQLITVFNACFAMYKKRNMVVLYDAIQTLVDRVELDDTQLSDLLPALVHKWESLSDDDKELWSLMECFSSVAAVMGEKFAPFALQVYQRATRVLAECIELDRRSVTDPSIHTREKDFIVTSLDLIDGLCQGLGTHSNELMDDTLILLVLETLKDTDDDVRQSAFALLGDLAIFVPEKVATQAEAVITAIMQEIVTRTFSSFAACNNACWAFGELALRIDMTAYCDRVIPVFIDLLNSQGLGDSVLENAAVALGRLAIRNPEFLAPHLAEFTLQWSANVMYLEENEEKETACQGMCGVVMSDPQALLRTQDGHLLITFLDVISAYQMPGDELAMSFQKVLIGYKELLGAEGWAQLLTRVSDGSELASRYGL